MPILVLCIVLGAALTHATWNLFLKQTGDRMAMMCVMHTVTGMLALAAMPWIGGIIAPESWPLLLTSVVIHGGYYLFLIRSYTHGDLGFTYPIARGMAPLLVGGASILLLGRAATLATFFDASASLGACASVSSGARNAALKQGGFGPQGAFTKFSQTLPGVTPYILYGTSVCVCVCVCAGVVS